MKKSEIEFNRLHDDFKYDIENKYINNIHNCKENVYKCKEIIEVSKSKRSKKFKEY